MKTKKFFLALMMVFAVVAVSCEKDEDKESCDGEDLAEDFGCPATIDAVATFCSDGVNKSYYAYQGKNYYCNGTDASTCDKAINQIGAILIEKGCSTKKSAREAGKIKLTQMAENLLEKVRCESLCD